MAPKEKKKRQFSCNKEANTKNARAMAWPDLPQQLLNLIKRQPTLMQNISLGGVSKSWRAAPKRCNSIGKLPWLELFNTNDKNGGRNYPHVFNHSFGQVLYKSYLWQLPSNGQMQYFVGYSYGNLVAMKGAYLWHPGQRGICVLPPWNRCVAFTSAALCYSDEISEESWAKQDYNLTDPNAPNGLHVKHLMQFSNAIGFEGKVYALSLHGTLAVIDIIDSYPIITSLGKTRAVPSIHSSHFREYLVEYKGEILLVLLISKKSINAVDDVEVFRLNFERLSWVKIHSLGDRTMFVGTNWCMLVLARKVSCKSNCVHFTPVNFDGGWVYDMEKRKMSHGTQNSSEKSSEYD